MSVTPTTFVASHPLRPVTTTRKPFCVTDLRPLRHPPCRRLLSRSLPVSCADSASAPAPASGSSSDSSAASASVPVASAIPGTPFTSNVLSSPMPRTDRAVYLSAVTSAVDAFLYDALSSNGTTGVDNDDDEVNTNKVTTSSINTVSASSATTTTSRIAQVTLLLPELNPSLDVYDRRFLLQVTWAVISSAVTTHGLRPRVLVQGRRAFGAIPLSVAGLRRHFDADLELSVDDWSRPIRSGDLEEVTDVDDDDDVIIIISPTNAVSCPVVQSVADCVRQKANGRPVILINPRLDDVPSHSGVMQVSGRADRIAFVDSFEQIFYLRLLFDAGSSYPLRGILYRSFPHPWQIWRSVNVDQDYRLIGEIESNPSSSDITDAFKRDSFRREKELLKQQSAGDASTGITDELLKPQIVVLAVAMLLAVAIPLLQNSTALNRLFSELTF